MPLCTLYIKARSILSYLQGEVSAIGAQSINAPASFEDRCPGLSTLELAIAAGLPMTYSGRTPGYVEHHIDRDDNDDQREEA